MPVSWKGDIVITKLRFLFYYFSLLTENNKKRFSFIFIFIELNQIWYKAKLVKIVNEIFIMLWPTSPNHMNKTLTKSFEKLISTAH